MPRLELCRRASPSFFAVVASPSLLVHHPRASPLRQMACACALLSACVLLPRGFAVAAWATPSCFAIASNGLHSRFAISSRSLPLLLYRCCACVALVRLRRSKWLALALRLQLVSFALAASPSRLCRHCLCFAVEADGSCLRFAVSLGYTTVACFTTPQLCFDLAAPALPSLCAWPLP
jgi:hypothetical protein